jgi:hypothetical protein
MWTNTSSSAAVIHVAALVQQLKGSADSVQMQLYVAVASDVCQCSP